VIRACLDADVLIPIESCDFLLTTAELGLYEAVTSPNVPTEIERNLLADWPHLDPKALRRRVRHVADFLRPVPSSATPARQRQAWVNRKDRHLLASALYHEAQAVVTNDRRLRDQINVRRHRIVAVSGDEFVAALQRSDPEGVEAVVATMVARRTRQPIQPEQLLERLREPFPQMVSQITATETHAASVDFGAELIAVANEAAAGRSGRCPGIVARTGEPCRLPTGHRGSCRSRSRER
jgi:predicted nucleic acid-binding protein